MIQYHRSLSPLISPATSMRVLSLRPGKGNDSIELELREFRRGEEYEAVSYVYADQVRNEPITIIDERRTWQVDTTITIRSALKHLRLVDRSRTLWIYELCVNGENNAEKRAQVLKMANIFEAATKVNTKYPSKSICK